VIESEVYLGDLPLMTDKGTFVVNGAERVVVSQLSRSAGIYFRDQLDLTLNWQFFATLIPSEGPWVDIETDSSDAVTVRIGQNKKFAITTLLRALHNFPVASPEGRFEVAYTELPGKTLAAPVVDPVTGEVLIEPASMWTTTPTGAPRAPWAARRRSAACARAWSWCRPRSRPMRRSWSASATGWSSMPPTPTR
jgi:DNA-directed RNA polymerase subunit beta